MSNNKTKPGLVAAISVGGAIKHSLAGTDPLEVLEPMLAHVAAGERDKLRKKLAPALEMQPEAPRGFYFQDFVPLEDPSGPSYATSGWMIVFQTEVAS